MAVAKPDREKSRRIVGTVLYWLGMFCGAILISVIFIVPAFFSDSGGEELQAMGIGALLAIPPLVVYLSLPLLLDRYDPEPWWYLVAILGWGGIAAIGFAGAINTGVDIVFSSILGSDAGSAVTACLSAPFVEEFWKGLGIFGVFVFLRRDFDGVVDGIVYATFCALGFAAIENITYYSRAALVDHGMGDALTGTVFMRAVLAPWGHPLYTSMTGIGFGISRETTKGWLRWMAPLGGYLCAVFLHATWNTAATLSGFLVVIMLPLWFLLVAGFLGIWIWLVRRKGRIIRDHLKDEVLLGNLTQWELDLSCSAFARMRAQARYGGAAGRQFVKAAARLGLSKWHAARAFKGRKMTVSADWIVPLRQELYALREEIATKLGGNIQRPQAWQPPAPQAYPQQQAYGQQQQYPGGYPPGGGGGYPPPGGGGGYPPPGGGYGRR